MFETVIEKIGRIISRQYGIDVQFEGNQAYTDGKKIVLPNFAELTPELKQDLHGYLDHEVAHCLFTDFKPIKNVETRFHKTLLNACEDVRIEREMIDHYPGCSLHLEPLNRKCRQKALDSWDKMPWPIRTIVSIRDQMAGDTPVKDKEIEKYIKVVDHLIPELNKARDTKTIFEITKKISDLITQEREKEQENDSDQFEEGDAGIDQLKDQKKESQDKNQDSQDPRESKTSESDGDSGDGDERSSKEGDDGSSGDSKQDESSSSDSEKSKRDFEDSLLNTPTNKSANKKEAKAWELHVHDIHTHIAKEIKAKVQKEDREIKKSASFELSKKVHVPYTTKFDTVTDHSKNKDSKKYASLKKEVQKYVAPTKRQLEQLLKVKENARWSMDQERGQINQRSLAQFCNDRNFRRPFKQYRREETNNVAVSLVIDCSGSMYYDVRVAQQTCVALGEALKDLNIPFEILGFNSVGHSKSPYRYSYRKPDTTRFNRVDEKLDHHVFKSFDSDNMNGIVKVFSGGNNTDGESIRWAANRLLERKEKRKILFVMNDGFPNAEGDTRILNNDLKLAVKEISKANIECIGVGIRSDAPKHFYPDFLVIENVKELPTKTMNKMKGLLTK